MRLLASPGRHLAIPLVLAVAASPALADRIAAPPPPPAKRMPPPSDADRLRDLEQRVTDLERELADLKAKVATAAPPVRPSRPTPDPSRRYHIPLDDSPSLGPKLAPITIVAGLQFPEPYTHRVWPTLKQLLAEHKDVRLVVKTYIVHPQHARSSIAACAAAYQGELDAMEDAIFAASQAPDPVTGSTAWRSVPDSETRDLARSLRLNVKQYDRDIAACETAQKRDIQELTAVGQSAVPMFWINGRPLSGAQPIESFRALIDEERAAWTKAKASGAKLSGYYERVTREKPNPY